MSNSYVPLSFVVNLSVVLSGIIGILILFLIDAIVTRRKLERDLGADAEALRDACDRAIQSRSHARQELTRTLIELEYRRNDGPRYSEKIERCTKALLTCKNLRPQTPGPAIQSFDSALVAAALKD